MHGLPSSIFVLSSLPPHSNITTSTMVKPLSFKGDKPKKRKHRTDDASNADPSRKTPKPSQSQPDADADADQSTEDQSWVSADAPSDLAGPVLLVLPSETPTAIAADATGKVFASALENTIAGDPGSAEPHDVRQVWVATRVAGTEGFSFRGCHGKYLSIDSHGLPSATASAISHHESFLIIPSPEIPGTFALQIHGGDKESFLSITDPADAGKSKSSGAVEIRGDATTLGFSSTLRIRMQARFKPRIKANKENRAMEKISRKELEGIVGRGLEDGEVKRLRRARREGAFHEEVLDVRVKGKHDKFA